MRLLFVPIFICFLLVAGLRAEPAHAVVTGTAAWEWAEYQRDLDDGPSTKASHFFQQYSLLYHDRQAFRDGRAGRWDVALGYEWTALDLSGSYDDEFDTGKILYQGELYFSPVGVPLSLHAYSHDLTRSTPAILTANDTLVDPRIYYGIYDGQHIITGVTLEVGESRPQRLANSGFNNVLVTLPRLLVDYRDEYIRDLNRFDPVHYRERDLAFISLNRKNNWFHYKVFEHIDYNDSTNDFRERMFLLGTIDQLDRRQWVNLTNWLAISVDGSLTRSEGGPYRRNWDSPELYRLNLFSVARRRDWNFSNFTSMSRNSNGDGHVEKTFDFPWYAAGQTDPQHKWKLAFIESSRDETNPRLLSSYDLKEDNLYGRAQLENSRRSNAILTTDGEAAWTNTSISGEAYATRLGAELRSPRHPGRISDWRAAYSIAWFAADQVLEAGDRGKADRDNSGLTYFEQVAEAGFNYSLSSATRVGMNQLLAVGFGTNELNTTKYIVPTISTEAFDDDYRSSPQKDPFYDGTSYRSITDAYLELTPPGSWRNRFNLRYDLLQTAISRHVFEASHQANFSSGQLRASTRTSLSEGDDLTYQTQAADLGGLEAYTGAPEMIFYHQASLGYTPNRFWETNGQLMAMWGDGPIGSGWILEARQDTAYHLFKAGGLMRRWLDFRERFEYQKIGEVSSLWFADLDFSVVWYATNYLTLDALVGARHFGLTSQTEYQFRTSATAAFRMLEARLAYAYGQRNAGNERAFEPGTTEQRWEVSLKKYF